VTDKLRFIEMFVLSHNREPPARVLYEKQSTGLFFYSPALLGGMGISPVATGDERLRLSTPQTFEKV